jgi:SAM-dependent methyltransferase
LNIEPRVTFDDGFVYERFMGRWSRAVGTIFLEWVAPSAGARWLDVGCGTGIFTQLILDKYAPTVLIGVDSSAVQIDYARKKPESRRAEFHVADAQKLPFAHDAFDVVTSALVINFIPDRHCALNEMRRVCRKGGTVATYVWDFAATHSPTWPLAFGLRQIGIEPPQVPGADDSSIEALSSSFARAGLEEIAARSIEVTVAFVNFDEFWRSQVSPFTSNGKVIGALPDAARTKLFEAVRSALPVGSDGVIAYLARANAVKASVPL